MNVGCLAPALAATVLRATHGCYRKHLPIPDPEMNKDILTLGDDRERALELELLPNTYTWHSHMEDADTYLKILLHMIWSSIITSMHCTSETIKQSPWNHDRPSLGAKFFERLFKSKN